MPSAPSDSFRTFGDVRLIHQDLIETELGQFNPVCNQLSGYNYRYHSRQPKDLVSFPLCECFLSGRSSSGSFRYSPRT